MRRDIGEYQWPSQGLGVLNHRAPSFEERWLHHGRGMAEDFHLILPRHQPQGPDLRRHAEAGGIFHEALEEIRVAVVVFKARTDDRWRDAPGFEHCESPENSRMVLVRPELISDVEELLREPVLGVRVRSAIRCGAETATERPHPRADHRIREPAPKVRKRRLATQQEHTMLPGDARV